MCYAGILLLIIPQMLLVLVSILCVISFAVLYINKRIVKLNKEEIITKKGSFVPLALMAWGFNLLALSAALIIMDAVSFSIPFLDKIHNEWGIAFANAYVPAIIYIVCLAFLHAGLLLIFCYFLFKKKIASKPKRIKILIPFAVSSALIWAFVMCFGLGVI
jgi:hypothetical protein